MIYLGAGKSDGQVNFETNATFGEVETCHSSPTILSPNVATHFLLDVTAVPDKDIILQEAKNIPLSLKRVVRKYCFEFVTKSRR